MSPQVSGAILTDPGRQRSVNEDWCGSLSPDDGDDGASVWVVADGVSQFGTGREAAKLAVETVLSVRWEVAEHEVAARLREAIEQANRALVRRAREGRSERGKTLQYPSTILAAVALGSEVWLANVGDCRAYLVRSGTIRQLTRDHTWVAEQIALGKLRAEDAAAHPRRNVLTRCLGQPSVKPDIHHETLAPGDRLVLCSDGLTRHASEAEIAGLAGAGLPREQAERLIQLANGRGGTDNITVAVLELAATAVPPPAASESEQTLSVLPDLSAARLRALQTISQRINSSLEVGPTLSSVMDSLVEITRAERGFIMLFDEGTGRLEFQIGRNLDAGSVTRDPQISRNIVDKVFRERQPLLIGDAMADSEFRAFESVVIHALRSVICAPLIVKGKSIGVVYVDNSLTGGLFGPADLDLVVAFANMAASAIENARLHERLAANVREISAMKTAQDRVLRSVSSGIISVDRNGTITSFNRAAAEMLAQPAEGAVGKPLKEILPPRFLLALGPPLAGDGHEPGSTIAGLEMAGEVPGRGQVYLEHRLSPLRDEAGATIGYVLVLDDLTDRRRLEEERRQAEKVRSVFEHFMPPDVFQELMRQGPDKIGIRGDRRELTVLFADIRGYTGLSERLGAEQVVDILNHYLAVATDVIFEQRGTIDKFIGDAIMALFGAPVQIPNHPLQAVKAALGMKRRFAETPRKGQRASFGIGVNTGSGMVGTIGAPQLMSYTVIGDVVNVAARLQQEARAGEILVSEATYTLVADDVEVEELGSISVKGRFEPVNVYKVIRLRR